MNTVGQVVPDLAPLWVGANDPAKSGSGTTPITML